MTSDEITSTLIANRRRESFTIPRFTPSKWFECDCVEVTKAGFLREYEIKTSRSDFLRDKKKRDAWRAKNKHDQLAAHDTSGPVQFWFVAPEGLLKLNEIPEWAGLIELVPSSPGSDRYYEAERIKAPRLHNERCSPATMRRLSAVCYWRFHGMLALKATAKKHAAILRQFGWPKVKPQAKII